MHTLPRRLEVRRSVRRRHRGGRGEQTDQHHDDDGRRRDRRRRVVRLRGGPQSRGPRSVRRSGGNAARAEDLRGSRGLLAAADPRVGGLAEPAAEVRRVTHAARSPRVERHGDRGGRRGGSLQAQEGARWRPVPHRLRGVGAPLDRERPRRRASVLAPSNGVGEGARPYQGETVRMRFLDSTPYDSGVTLLRYEPDL
jgi:hypothetical protein